MKLWEDQCYSDVNLDVKIWTMHFENNLKNGSIESGVLATGLRELKMVRDKGMINEFLKDPSPEAKPKLEAAYKNLCECIDKYEKIEAGRAAQRRKEGTDRQDYAKAGFWGRLFWDHNSRPLK